MLRVRDIMTRDVVSLAADTSIDRAVWSFSANAISGAPVRDLEGNIIGVLSKSDLVDPIHHHRVTGETPVSEAMTPAAWAIHPDAPVIDAVRLMVRKSVHRVLVVHRAGEIDGIVTSMDVMRAFLDDGHLGDPTRPPEKHQILDAAARAASNSENP